MILISTHAEADFADLIAQSPAADFVPKPGLSADAITTKSGVCKAIVLDLADQLGFDGLDAGPLAESWR